MTHRVATIALVALLALSQALGAASSLLVVCFHEEALPHLASSDHASEQCPTEPSDGPDQHLETSPCSDWALSLSGSLEFTQGAKWGFLAITRPQEKTAWERFTERPNAEPALDPPPDRVSLSTETNALLATRTTVLRI